MKKTAKITALVLALVMIVSLFAACGKPDPKKALVGSWRDSAGILGFDFNEDGTGNIVAADFTLPIINISLKGTYEMTYTVETDENDVTTLHISFTFAVPVNLDFTITVDGDILRLSHESGLNYTMTRVVESDTAPATDNASQPVSE